MKLLQKLLPHLLIAVALAVGVIIYVDNRNPNMEFLRCRVGNSYVYVLCVLAALSGIFGLCKEEADHRTGASRTPDGSGKTPEQGESHTEEVL